MLSFASEFPVKERDPGAFVMAVRRWLEGSPHTTLTPALLADLPEDGRWKAETSRERLEAMLSKREGEATIAFKHTTLDASIEWTTVVAFSSTLDDAWVGIRTSRESSQAQLGLPPAKKPLVVRTVLSELGGGLDGEIFVSDAPLYLKDNDVNMAIRLINSDSDNYLPIVYISCGFDGRLEINPEPLARHLSGMAHVVVEPDREFSRKLQQGAGSNNVYGGRAAIYWPNGTRYSYFLNEETPTEFDVRRLLGNRLRAALLNRRPLARCTWARAEAEVARSAFEQLRASGSNDVNEYVKIFDAEIEAKNKQIDDAESEISKLRSQLRSQADLRTSAQIGLNFGSEQEFYTGEFEEIISDSLSFALNQVQADSRKQHVLTAAVSALGRNSRGGNLRESLKSLLRNYTSMDHSTRKGLEDLGFSISEDGKHHKLIYKNDDRYTFALPKSGSDYRGGLNAFSDISKRIF